MSGTCIVNCVFCTPNSPAGAFQDRKYGKQQRVANFCKDGAKCTVCDHMHRVERPAKKKSSGGGSHRKIFIAVPPSSGWPGGPIEKNGWKPL